MKGRASARWELVGLLAAIVLCYVALVCTPGGQRLDATVFSQLPEVDTALHPVLEGSRLVVPIVLAVVVCGFAIRALVRRHWREVVSACVLVLVASVIAVAAKPLLPRPHFGTAGYPWNTFPSGHMAVTTSLLCAGLWLCPWWVPQRRARTVSWVLGTAFGWALVISYAHREADVAGAGLLVALVVAILTARRHGVALPRAVWARLAVVAGLGVAFQLVAAYLPLPGVRFLGALGTALVIATTCGSALLLVPSPGRDVSASARRRVRRGARRAGVR